MNRDNRAKLKISILDDHQKPRGLSDRLRPAYAEPHGLISGEIGDGRVIGFDDFLKVELRVGRIVSAEEFPEARTPAYRLLVDFGAEIGTRQSSAQITDLYSRAELVGKLVVAVVNLPPKQIGPVRSECLVTGFHDSRGHVALCIPDRDVPLGTRLL